jgi:hypothetical protein
LAALPVEEATDFGSLRVEAALPKEPILEDLADLATQVRKDLGCWMELVEDRTWLFPERQKAYLYSEVGPSLQCLVAVEVAFPFHAVEAPFLFHVIAVAEEPFPYHVAVVAEEAYPFHAVVAVEAPCPFRAAAVVEGAYPFRATAVAEPFPHQDVADDPCAALREAWHRRDGWEPYQEGPRHQGRGDRGHWGQHWLEGC